MQDSHPPMARLRFLLVKKPSFRRHVLLSPLSRSPSPSKRIRFMTPTISYLMISCRIAQPISQLHAKDFDRFWTDRLNSGPFRLISSARLAETSSTVISLAEFRYCFRALLSGLGSWVFKVWFFRCLRTVRWKCLIVF